VTSMNIHLTQHMTFMGTHGRIHLAAPFNAGGYAEARLELTQADGAMRVERWPTAQQYVNQVEAFSNAVRSGDAYPWSLEDAKMTQGVIDAIYARCPIQKSENEKGR